MSDPPAQITATLASLGIEVLERDWLSSNSVLFTSADPLETATVVDTGYSRDAPRTVELLRQRLRGRALGRVVNTHLHSDHCGGNAEIIRRFGSSIWVPDVSLEVVRQWDEKRLTYHATDQRCERFAVAGGVRSGSEVRLGGRPWQAWSTPGHDPDALVYFEPRSKVLIAGDALWRDRLAIIFPALAGADGFSGVRETLRAIESLAPRVVIPGHGPAFTDVSAALRSSRERLAAFEREPAKHFSYALRALAMFRMLEYGHQRRAELRAWMRAAPVLEAGRRALALDSENTLRLVDACLDRLQADGQLARSGDILSVVAR